MTWTNSRQIVNEENPTDLQMTMTGMTDRNIEEYLGLFEQRIDDLIQVCLLIFNCKWNASANF